MWLTIGCLVQCRLIFDDQTWQNSPGLKAPHKTFQHAQYTTYGPGQSYMYVVSLPITRTQTQPAPTPIHSTHGQVHAFTHLCTSITDSLVSDPLHSWSSPCIHLCTSITESILASLTLYWQATLSVIQTELRLSVLGEQAALSSQCEQLSTGIPRCPEF